jgi:hypothetical protein
MTETVANGMNEALARGKPAGPRGESFGFDLAASPVRRCDKSLDLVQNFRRQNASI